MTSTIQQYVSFSVGNEIYAVPVTSVREIVNLSKVTKVPLTPEYFEGIMNLRGEVLPVIKLRKLLQMPSENLESEKVVILTNDGMSFGIIVDKTWQVLHVNEKEEQEATTESQFVSKIIRKDDNIYLVLDLENLFRNTVLFTEKSKKSQINRSGTGASNIEAKDSSVGSREYMQLVTFELAGGIYAFRIEGIQEIIRYTDPTPVPGAPHYLKGFIELRKIVLPLIDLRTLLGMESVEANEFTKVIVLRLNNSLFGVVIDRIRGVLRVSKSELLPPPSIGDASHTDELIGIVQRDKETILVLDHNVFAKEELNEIKGAEMAEGEVVEGIDDAKTINSDNKYVVFVVGEEEYGVPIDAVREVNRISNLSKVPKAPEHLVGLMNLRGDVIPVVDLRIMFGVSNKRNDQSALRVVVYESGGKKIGYIIDSVIGVLRIPYSSIVDISDTIIEGDAARFVTGVARLDDRLVLLLDMDTILTEEEKARLNKTVEKVVDKVNRADEVNLKEKEENTNQNMQQTKQTKKLKKAR
ncbi:chemotaxis protein CheW [Fervidobacterium sp.]